MTLTISQQKQKLKMRQQYESDSNNPPPLPHPDKCAHVCRGIAVRGGLRSIADHGGASV